MGRVKRSNSLSWIFMRYVLVMLGSLVGLVIVAWLLLYLLISVGCIYPANYAEQKINEAYDTILRADKVTAEMIPALCDYVIFSENGEKIGGDLSEQYEQIPFLVRTKIIAASKSSASRKRTSASFLRIPQTVQ